MRDRRRTRRSLGASRPGRRSPSRVDGRLRVASEWMYVGSLVIAPQLLGGTFAWATTLIAVLSIVSLAAVLVAYRGDAVLRSRGTMALAFMVPLAWTLLQALPLPCDWLGWIVPDAVAELRASLRAVDVRGIETCTLTRAPGATHEEVVKLAAMAAMFAAGRVLVEAGRRSLLLRGAALSGIAMATVGVAHELAAADRVFGLYAPVWARPRVLAPLMNDNHYAGFLAMTLPPAIYAAVSAEGRGRIAWSIGAAAIVLVCLLTLSRGGIAALVLGAVLTTAGLALRRRRRPTPRGALPAVLAISLGAGVGCYLALDRILRAFAEGTFVKLGLAGDALAFGAEHPWTGVGRGGFQAAFEQRTHTNALYTHPENFVAQWATEWGYPFTVVLLIGIGVLIVAALRDRRSRSQTIGAFAIVTVLAHDLVDFSLEMTGVAVVAAALLASATRRGVRERETPEPVTTRVSLGWALGLTLAVVSIVVIVLGPRIPAQDVAALRDRLADAARRQDRGEFREVLIKAVHLHPSEAAFLVSGGAEAVRHRDPKAIRLLNRAMTLAPGWASPHLEAARYFLSVRRFDQGLLELREAASRDPDQARPLLCAALQARPDIATVRRVAPVRGTKRRRVLDHAAACLHREPAAAAAIDDLILREAPQASGPRLRRAKRLIEAHRIGEAVTELESLAEGSSDPQIWLALGRARLRAGSPEGATEAARQAERNLSDPTPSLELRVRAAAQAHHPDEMRAGFEELRGISGGDPERLFRTLRLLGDLEAELGNEARAIRAYEEAYGYINDSRLMRRVAVLAESLGDRARAYRAYRRLAELHPDNRSYQAAVDRLERVEPLLEVGQP